MKRWNTSKRIISMVAVLATLFVVLFSAFYLSENSKHHCEDKGCLVCEMMQQCSNNLRTIGGATVIAAFLCFIIVKAVEFHASIQEEAPILSLISLKVRIND